MAAPKGRLTRRAEELAPKMARMRIGLVAILAAWAVFFSVDPIRGLFWSSPGDFQVTTDSSLTVNVVDAGSAAARAGIRIGDRFAATTSFENRLYLQAIRNPHPGQILVAKIVGHGGPGVIHLVAIPMEQEYDAYVIVYYFSVVIVDLIFLVVGAALVLLRPSKMAWGFFFFCVAAQPGLHLGTIEFAPWFVFGNGVFADALSALGLASFLLFSVRAPNDQIGGRWRYLEAPGAGIVFVAALACSIVVDLSILGYLHADRVASRIRDGIYVASYIAGLAALIATFLRAHGVNRERTAWIVAGFAIGLGAHLAAGVTDPLANIYTGDRLSDDAPAWLLFIPLFQVAIPLTVAYAVVRHRAFDAGLIANRTLVYGLFLCGGFAAFALLDILVTKKFAHNQFEVGLDIALALAIGLIFQFVHPRAIRLIDRIFLPERYQAAVRLDKLRSTLGLRGNGASPNRAIETVAQELLLASLAVFKKAPDGGFVRYAAAGWPKGTTWHILAGDPLLQSFGAMARVGPINEENTLQFNVPAEPGRPAVGISLSPQTAAGSLILVGVHLNGRRPDYDEVRGIASLLREFVKNGNEIGSGLDPAAALRSLA